MRMGASTSGNASSTMPVSLGLVTNSRPMPPTSMMPLRSAMERDEPITDCSSVVSAVSRDWISEARLLS
ncbi:hypothetical protein FQZ97_1233120 [compost metagenome]